MLRAALSDKESEIALLRDEIIIKNANLDECKKDLEKCEYVLNDAEKHIAKLNKALAREKHEKWSLMADIERFGVRVNEPDNQMRLAVARVAKDLQKDSIPFFMEDGTWCAECLCSDDTSGRCGEHRCGLIDADDSVANILSEASTNSS